MGRAKSICVRGLTSLLLVLIAALVLPGCVSSPEHRTGEYFLFTKRQFRLVDEASNANDSHMNPFAVFAPFAMLGGSIIGVTIAPAVDILCIPYDTSMKTHCTVIKVVDEEGDPVPGVMDGMGCLCETYLNEEENEISLEARPGDDDPAYQRSSNEPGYRRGRVEERIGRL